MGGLERAKTERWREKREVNRATYLPTFYCDVAITAIREFGMRSPIIEANPNFHRCRMTNAAREDLAGRRLAAAFTFIMEISSLRLGC